MKIAAITITHNDDYKFNEWCSHYEEYKDELYLHIIIDNASELEYFEKVKAYFTTSLIIRRKTNGGCTIAYNEGMRYALACPEVDSIMLIGNDIRFPQGATSKLYEFLFSRKELGMVEPVILKKDSDVVEDFGCHISSRLVMKPLNVGDCLNSLLDSFHVVEAVTGGMNLSKREFYEKIGLQDSKLFMYSDEVDMGLRAKKLGFKMAATKTAIAWHQHINPSGKQQRMPYTSYLTGRNKVYLANKHFGLWGKINQMSYHLFLFGKGIIRNLFNREGLIHQFYFLKGSYNGFVGDMDLSKIIKGFKADEDNA